MLACFEAELYSVCKSCLSEYKLAFFFERAVHSWCFQLKQLVRKTSVSLPRGFFLCAEAYYFPRLSVGIVSVFETEASSASLPPDSELWEESLVQCGEVFDIHKSVLVVTFCVDPTWSLPWNNSTVFMPRILKT